MRKFKNDLYHVGLVGLVNVEGGGIFDEATKCGIVLGTKLKSNLQNWIQSAKGRSSPIVTANDL